MKLSYRLLGPISLFIFMWQGLEFFFKLFYEGKINVVQGIYTVVFFVIWVLCLREIFK